MSWHPQCLQQRQISKRMSTNREERYSQLKQQVTRKHREGSTCKAKLCLCSDVVYWAKRMETDLVFSINQNGYCLQGPCCCVVSPLCPLHLFNTTPDKLTCPKHYPFLQYCFSSSVAYLIKWHRCPSLRPDTALSPHIQWLNPVQCPHLSIFQPHLISLHLYNLHLDPFHAFNINLL